MRAARHGVLTVALGLAGPAWAQEPLTLQVDPALIGCPTREELAAQVAALGKEAAGRGDRPVEVAFYPKGEGVGATISVRGGGADPAGQRELSLPARDCRELGRMTALTIAIALDSQLAGGPVPGPAPPRRAPLPAPPPVVAETVASPPTSRVSAAFVAHVGAGFGLAPSPVPVVGLGVVVRRDWLSLRFEGLLAGYGAREVAGGRVGAWLAGGGLLPCGHLGRVALCAGGWLALYRASSHDLTDARTESGAWVGLGARGGLALWTFSRFELSVQAQALWSPRRFRLVDSQNGATFWLMPRFGGTVGLALSAPL